MAQPRVKYIASFADSSYGIDSEGELFFTIADAVAALYARHKNGYHTHCEVTLISGSVTANLFPAVSNEAYLQLWRLDADDQLALETLEHEARNGKILYALTDYCEAEPDVVVWVGARQAIRHGSFAAFAEQRRIRGHQDAREAGSVVVTDV